MVLEYLMVIGMESNISKGDIEKEVQVVIHLDEEGK